MSSNNSVTNLPTPVYTAMPLEIYAQTMGINPIQFRGARSDNAIPRAAGCEDIWQEYPWQDDGKVSRDQLRQALADAELDIASALGAWPAPRWYDDEEVRYPRHHRREWHSISNRNARGHQKGIPLRQGMFLRSGRRRTTLLGEVRPVHRDYDGDGFAEVMELSLAGVTATTDPREIGIFFRGGGGHPSWEIRPPLKASISGSGVYSASFPSWLFINPEMQSAWRRVGDPSPLDADEGDSYVDTVEIRRVYADPADQATLIWNSGSPGCTCGGVGCSFCGNLTQTACVNVTDSETGIITAQPGEYDNGWSWRSYAGGRDPDRLRLSYLAGYHDRGVSHHWAPLPALARAAVYIAVARLARPLCTSCENISQREAELKLDMAVASPDRSRIIFSDLLNSPFGTRAGEVEAWRLVLSVRKVEGHRVTAGVL